MIMTNEKTRNTQRKNGDKTPQARRKASDVERKIKEKAEEQRKWRTIKTGCATGINPTPNCVGWNRKKTLMSVSLTASPPAHIRANTKRANKTQFNKASFRKISPCICIYKWQSIGIYCHIHWCGRNGTISETSKSFQSERVRPSGIVKILDGRFLFAS